MAVTETSPAPAPSSSRDFDVTGMTCGACAARVQRVLTRSPGVVEASVNLALMKASVTFDPRVVGTDELAAAVDKAGYALAPAPSTYRPPAAVAAELDDIEAHEERRWRWRLLVAAPLAALIEVLSLTRGATTWGRWTAVALTVPVVFGAGWPFLVGAVRQARRAHANMDVLVALGSLAALAYSVREAALPASAHAAHGRGGHAHLDMAALIVAFLVVGRWLEARARQRAGRALRALAMLGAATGRRVDETEVLGYREVPVEELQAGDRFIVLPGDRVPVDGVVLTGRSAVDESMLTGESLPVDKEPGALVVAASLNTNGTVTARATAVGADTTFARIVALVEQAQTSKPPVQRLADRAAGLFVPIVIGLAALTFAGWAVAGRAGTGALAAVAVLLVACPCSLGLATPVAVMVGTGRSASLGILINGGEALERCDRVDTVVFDKTGTLTEGRLTVVGHWISPDADEGRILALVGSAEATSEHPIAAAIVAFVRTRGVDLVASDRFSATAGHGIDAVVDGARVRAGRPDFVGDHDRPEALVGAADGWDTEGASVVVATVDDRLVAAFALGDVVRPDAVATVAHLRAQGMRVALVSGDGEAAVAAVAATVGIDDVIARATPEGKVEAVRARQARGERVAMVGDGVNDAAALATADVGVAMGSGTAVARQTAGIVLLSNRVDAVPRAIGLARATYTTILQNLGWAFGYNIAAIPLAAAGRLPPAVASLTMGLSSVCVVTNSLRLRRADGGPASVRSARSRRRSVVVAWIVPLVALLAVGAGIGLLDARRPDVSVRVRSAAGHEVLVDIDDVHAGRNTVHAYLSDASGRLATARWLRMRGRRIDPVTTTPLEVDAVLDPAGFAHFTGSIDLGKGYWLLTVVGVDADGRPIEAALNLDVA